MEFQQIVAAHETAGDKAREHHLYEDAAQHYQSALGLKTSDSSNGVRISEKLAYVLSLSANPQAAAPLFDHVLNAYLLEPAHAEKTIELLLQQARQRWLDTRTEDALPLIAQAVRIADVSGTRKLRMLTRARMANYLLGLNRFEEAKDLLQTCGSILPDEDINIISTFSTQKAIIAAAYGEKEQALMHFERAIGTAKNDPDPYQLVAVWHTQRVWMLALGETEIAKTSSERALALARQQHIPWLTHRYCLAYADILFLLGEYEKAHEYFLQALAYEVNTPLLNSFLAGSGLLIALHARNIAAISRITRTFDPEVMLQTGDPASIAALVTVFAHWHIVEGRANEAEQLLRRAVLILGPIKLFGDIWSFPITVARYGAWSDLSQARKIIETRVMLPCASVAQATMSLFDACVAEREGRYRKASRCAKDAAQRFKILGWHSYVDIAKALLSVRLETTRGREEGAVPLGSLTHVLTLREQEIAGLLRKGLTNQEIAEKLSISRHTVHTHVASVMTRLGLHSRHQLVNVLPLETDP